MPCARWRKGLRSHMPLWKLAIALRARSFRCSGNHSAPHQPFISSRRINDGNGDRQWPLLGQRHEFGKHEASWFVEGTRGTLHANAWGASCVKREMKNYKLT